MKKIFCKILMGIIVMGTIGQLGATTAFASSDELNIISRKEWGADESYRFITDGKEPELVELSDDFYEKYADELKYSRIVERDRNGDEYKWPLKYPEEVKKIIVHHTGTTKNLDNPKQAIRDIYYYHAISRGWGDIGYNYIIDQDGNIYEGRYGGEGVIGAHAGAGNHGSIGIAILGNYENEPVPKKAITALVELIKVKSAIHGIDPDGKSVFRGEKSYNVIGHRDIAATDCPGDELYKKLKTIRSLAAEGFEEKKKYQKDYDFQDKSKLYYLELESDEVIGVTVKMQNIGKKTWDEKTFIVVDRDPEFDGVISFPGKEGVALAYMDQSSVRPGAYATFKFQIRGGNLDKTVNMKIAPVINGSKKTSDYMVLPVAVFPVAEESEDIRIKLSFEGDPEITGDGLFRVYSGDNLLRTIREGQTVSVSYGNGEYKVDTKYGTYKSTEPVIFKPLDSTILRIDNFENRPGWDESLNDNEYRGNLEVQYVDEELVVINELPMENYLKGLGEVSNYEPIEKIKAIMVAARSYAQYYISEDEKFPGKPYHLDDDPATTQKYLGYGLEKRSPNVASAVDATEGEVVFYNGELVKTPYFNSTDGSKTKSALEVWNWNAPYLVSVDDSYCDGDGLSGHGVGLSGCGAKGMALQGYGYKEILKHYYTGVEIKDLW